MNRFLAAHALLLALKGMPGIYINSFLANRNDYEGLNQSGINRRINRHKFDFDNISLTMRQAESEAFQVNAKFVELINLKKTIKAFHPDGSQEVLNLDTRIIAFNRTYNSHKVMVVINISNQELSLNYNVIGKDLYNQEDINNIIAFRPYQVRWIEVK
jgi:sucrose phosphorylase